MEEEDREGGGERMCDVPDSVLMIEKWRMDADLKLDGDLEERNKMWTKKSSEQIMQRKMDGGREGGMDGGRDESERDRAVIIRLVAGKTA